MRILVVEDEPYSRRALVETIRRFDPSFVVAEADDGEEGLARMREGRFELVIADIRMPVMDGMEMSRRIREEHPEVMIALLTGYAEFDYALAALRLGVREYLLKPVENDRLFALLGEVRERSTHYGDRIVDDLNGYLYANLHGRIHIAEICKTRLFLDPAYVSRHYKAVTGMTIAETVRVLRMEQARRLLQDTLLGISDVGAQCGYQNVSSFIQSFEKQYGTTPAEYRRSFARK